MNSNGIIDTAVGTIFQLADGSIQSCDRASEKILGYTVAEMTAKSLQITNCSCDPSLHKIHPAIAFSNSESVVAALKTGLPHSAKQKFYRPDGSSIELELNSQPLFCPDSDRPWAVVTNFREIAPPSDWAQPTLYAERYPLGRDRQQSVNKNFKALADAIPGILYLFDVASNRNLYISQQSYSLLGYTPQEILDIEPNFVVRVMHPDDLAQLPAHIERLQRSKNGEVGTIEYRMRHKNGEWRWFSSQDRVYSRNDGSVKQILGVARDITQSKQTEIALKESEARLRLATAASGTGMWFWDLLEDTLEFTEQSKVIFGVPLDAELTYEMFLEILHPEDRDRVKQTVDQALAERTEYNSEYRAVWSDGSVHWIVAKGRGFYEEENKPIGMMGTVQDITPLKRSQQQLRENEKLLRLALANAKAGTWSWNIVSQEVVWCPENYALYGIDPQTKPLQYVDWEGLLHPDDRDRSNREVAKVLLGETTEFSTEFRIVHPQQGVRWLLGTGNVIRDPEGKPIRLSGINLDISHLKEAEQALQQSKEELKLITEVIPQQIWSAATDGQIDYINQRWQDYTGLDLQQMRLRGWSAIVHPDDLPAMTTNWIWAIKTKQKFDTEARLRSADGTYRWFISQARPLRNERGEIVKWYGTNTHITRIKELEAELLQQAEDLRRANQLKDQFLAIVSHELRTPLNPILGWTQLLASGKLTEDRIAMGVETIGRNARLQAQLIDDLLDVSHILRGKLDLKLFPLNLESIIKSAINTVQLAAKAKSIQIETEFESKIGEVLGDAARLQQIVWNLVSNAIKFTPEGGRISVKLKRNNTEALVKVEDTGQGIDAEFLPYVFDRFRQAESSNTRKFGGLGLGLAIVRHLTELHGGTVAVSSPGLGRGAIFSVKLPLMNIPTTEQIDYGSTVDRVQPNRFSGIYVMVVDDEIDSLDILTLILEQEGAEVASVASADEALAAFKEKTPNLIISDIGMPKTDGYSLMTQIRALPQGSDVPAIALTAYAGEIDKQLSFDAGFQKHIAKPVSLPELIGAVAELVQ